MADLTIAGRVLFWGDDDRPSAPKPPVRNLEEDLMPPVDLAANFRDPFGDKKAALERAAIHRRAFAARAHLPRCRHCTWAAGDDGLCRRRRCREIDEGAR